MGESVVDQAFPFDSYREKQFETLQVAFDALFSQGFKNIVIDAPTGVGKSAINVAIGRHADDAFYTTPQKKLREQLREDEVLSDHLAALRARKDYTCRATGDNCKDCHINQDPEQSCVEQAGQCTYWNNKMRTINAEIAVLTFSYLIVDGNIPAENESGEQISFEDQRDVVVVDEGHGLEDQVSSLHAGFKISPFNLPFDVYDGLLKDIDIDEVSRYGEVEDEIETLASRCGNVVRGVPEVEMDTQEKNCKRMLDRIKWLLSDVNEYDNAWVCEGEWEKYKGQYCKTLELKPVNVAGFLKNFVWSRGKKRVISTATMPYRGNPDLWLHRIGLDPNETKVIRVGMPFPPERRPIHTSEMIGSMSSGGDKDYWDEIMDTLNKLAKRHSGERALVHTSSYSRAERVMDSIRQGDYPYLEENVIMHEGEKDMEVLIEDWQYSDHDIVLSPAMTEGVDLAGDMCRWQVLLKVPYPNYSDARVNYMLEETGSGWRWYYETTANRIIQSVGRAVRSKDDQADFYILDEDFNKVQNRVTFPNWFEEAIDICDPGRKGLMDI